ncbi:unnamed protein product [Oikopleura dioica]|uniref:Uncharacterized protein n=1 Tax=Oikopleura dioica TaxID=34765 RepID=E4XMV7_OIKDI|nr:unnamed protein product [Oikopleura dioica]
MSAYLIDRQFKLGNRQFVWSCILVAIECLVLKLNNDLWLDPWRQMKNIQLSIFFTSVTVFFLMLAGIINMRNSNKKRLISEKKKMWLAIMIFLSINALFSYNIATLSTSSQPLSGHNYIGWLLIVEMVVAGIILIITLWPYCGIEHKQSYRPAAPFQSCHRRSENIEIKYQNIVSREIDEDLPKYENLFTQSN